MENTRVYIPPEYKEQFFKLRDEEDKHHDTLQRLTEQLQIELANRKRKYLTYKELSHYSNDVPVFGQLGNAFVLEDAKELAQRFRTDIGKNDQKIYKVKQTGIYIVGQYNDVRKQINDLIVSFQHL